MRPIKPVTVPRGAFAFCRYNLAAIPLIALIFQIKWLIPAGCAIMLLSAILKVGKAPMILLYSWTLNKIFKSADTVLDENAMFFAHSFGTLLFAIATLLLYFGNEKTGWIFVGFLAVAKTIGAMGFCAAGKMYTCMNNSSGNCCKISRKLRK